MSTGNLWIGAYLELGSRPSRTFRWDHCGFRVGPTCSAGKESVCNAGDLGSIPGLGRSPGEGNSYPLQYSGLENSMDCIVHGVANSQTPLSDFHFHFIEECLSFNYFPKSNRGWMIESRISKPSPTTIIKLSEDHESNTAQSLVSHQPEFLFWVIN